MEIYVIHRDLNYLLATRPGQPASAALPAPHRNAQLLPTRIISTGSTVVGLNPKSLFHGFCPGALASSHHPKTVKDSDESLHDLVALKQSIKGYKC